MEGISKNNTEKELTEEEILNSNNVELIAKYAKKNRSKVAIDKARELLEIARKTGEEVIQKFFSSLKECEKAKADYLSFENTESGKVALDLLEKMPEPFKTNASIKLEGYKKELKYNTELFKKHKNNPEEVWKEIFGFDYYNIPNFKERFKDFLFKNTKALSEKYYKDNAIEAKQDPFAINFFIEDEQNFDKAFAAAYEKDEKDAHKIYGAFSSEKNGTHVNVFNVNKSLQEEELHSDTNETIPHESEHAIHRHTNPFRSRLLEPFEVNEQLDFSYNKEDINYTLRFDFEERLKLAKDEIFAYFKGGTDKKDLEYILTNKDTDAAYDYSKEARHLNNKIINNHIYLSETEKQKLKDAVNFLQSEYDRVLKNMIDVIYENNHSVEFFRNVPINELWKYSNEKYKRTDFIIREFKF